MAKLMNIRLIILCFFSFLLCQCAKVSESHLQVNQQLSSPYTLPASSYLAMASQEQGQEKQQAYIMAAGRMIHDGHWRKGLAILAQTSQLTSEQRNERSLLQAKTELMRERPQQAVLRLSSVHQIDSMPLYYQVQYHEMLAQAYQAQSKETESVSERMKLDQLLPDTASKTNNRRALWLSLSKLPVADLNTLSIEASDNPELQGWMRLASISRQGIKKSTEIIADVQQWVEEYPHHPANQILPASLSQVAANMYPNPEKMALLLPLSGPLAGPGQAVRDGFIVASQKDSHRSSIKVYDTSKGRIADIYQQALSDGADYVVGPLSKTDVAVVAAMDHPVPTLLLNDSDARVKSNAFLFGLSPSEEAKQVATKARQNGHMKALILSPEGAWGEEVSAAFSEAWKQHGGSITDQLVYKQKDDLSHAISEFLRITQSQERQDQLKQLFGKRLQSTPRRRQDFDMIFLLAYPSKARQIMPLLKYNYAGDVPVYSTSLVYGGHDNTVKDRDLDGIIFCDMPWMFTHQVGQGHWPEQLNSYNRLYALGMDSYTLASQLNQLMLFPAMGASEKSGVLYLKSQQQVARILEWGQFKQGLATPLVVSG